MGNSDGEDVGFRYEWDSVAYETSQWQYHVTKEDPLAWRRLGSIRRELTEAGERIHHYHAFENIQRTDMFFPTLEEAKAWVVACTMGEKP